MKGLRHHTRVTRTGIKRQWAVECRCGSRSEWHFWENAISRANKHVFMPGVYR